MSAHISPWQLPPWLTLHRLNRETPLPLRLNKDIKTELPRSQPGNQRVLLGAQQSPVISGVGLCPYCWERNLSETCISTPLQPSFCCHSLWDLLVQQDLVSQAVYFTTTLEVLSVSREKSGFRDIPILVLNITMKGRRGKN